MTGKLFRNNEYFCAVKSNGFKRKTLKIPTMEGRRVIPGPFEYFLIESDKEIEERDHVFGIQWGNEQVQVVRKIIEEDAKEKKYKVYL